MLCVALLLISMINYAMSIVSIGLPSEIVTFDEFTDFFQSTMLFDNSNSSFNFEWCFGGMWQPCMNGEEAKAFLGDLYDSVDSYQINNVKTREGIQFGFAEYRFRYVFNNQCKMRGKGFIAVLFDENGFIKTVHQYISDEAKFNAYLESVLNSNETFTSESECPVNDEDIDESKYPSMNVTEAVLDTYWNGLIENDTDLFDEYFELFGASDYQFNGNDLIQGENITNATHSFDELLTDYDIRNVKVYSGNNWLGYKGRATITSNSGCVKTLKNYAFFRFDSNGDIIHIFEIYHNEDRFNRWLFNSMSNNCQSQSSETETLELETESISED